MQGIYSNQQSVMFKNNEFRIDFYQTEQQDPQPIARVYMTFEVAMKLRDALDSMVGQFVETCLKKKQKPKESEKGKEA